MLQAVAAKHCCHVATAPHAGLTAAVLELQPPYVQSRAGAVAHLQSDHSTATVRSFVDPSRFMRITQAMIKLPELERVMVDYFMVKDVGSGVMTQYKTQPGARELLEALKVSRGPIAPVQHLPRAAAGRRPRCVVAAVCSATHLRCCIDTCSRSCAPTAGTLTLSCPAQRTC